MKKWIWLGFLIFILLAIAYGWISGIIPTILSPKYPMIEKFQNSWGDVTPDTTEIITNVTIYNPNPMRIPIKVSYDVFMNDIKMAFGEAKGIDLKAEGRTTIELRTYLDNGKIPKWWVSHLRKGERTELKLDSKATLDLRITEFVFPFLHRLEVPTEISKKLSSQEEKEIGIGPILLVFKSLESSWGRISEKETEIDHKIVIYNPNPYPVSLSTIDYGIEMNEIKIGEGTTYNPVILSPKSDTTVPFTTKIDNYLIDEWWVTHIRRGEVSKMFVKIQPKVEVFGIEYKFTVAEIEEEIRTDFLKRGI